MDNYICKIASIKEMQEKWDYEISNALNNKSNWIKWKKEKWITMKMDISFLIMES